jgi:copper(I)-binding protein
MKTTTLRTVTSALALCLLAAAVQAHEYYTGTFTVVHPWTDPTATGAVSAPVYLKLEQITADDRLVEARSPFAGKIELRSGSADAKAVPVKAIALKTGVDLDLNAASVHLVMLDLKSPLQWGRSYPLTLVFEKAGAIDTMLSVGAH